MAMVQKDSQLPQIVLTGSLAVDQILHFNGSLAAELAGTDLKTLSLSVLLTGFEKSLGGVAGNIAYSLALLGEVPVLYASLGRDQTEYLNKLTTQGVDTSQVHLSELATASFTVLTDKNGGQIGGFYPGAMSDAQSLSLEKFQNHNSLIVISAHDPAQMAVQIQQVEALKLRLVFDLGQQVAALDSKVIVQGLNSAEVLLVNEFELELISKKTGLNHDQIFKLVPLVIVTLAEKGCLAYDQSSSPLVVKAVTAALIDPTGAGDAFRAGFLYGFIRNWSVKKSCQLAATTAAVAVESHGTQNHFFDKKTLATRYQLEYHQVLDWA